MIYIGEITLRQVLQEAAALVRKGWCRTSVYARDRYGFACEVTSPVAAYWCLVGAIRVATRGNYQLERQAVDVLETALDLKEPIENWNDRQNDASAVVDALETTARSEMVVRIDVIGERP